MSPEMERRQRRYETFCLFEHLSDERPGDVLEGLAAVGATDLVDLGGGTYRFRLNGFNFEAKFDFEYNSLDCKDLDA